MLVGRGLDCGLWDGVSGFLWFWVGSWRVDCRMVVVSGFWWLNLVAVDGFGFGRESMVVGLVVKLSVVRLGLVVKLLVVGLGLVVV